MSQTDVLRCPKCRTTPLRAPGRSGTPVLRCYACHGMWVTTEQAEALALAGTLLDPDSMLPQKVRGDDVAGLCPSGHGLLQRAKVDLDEPFYLERCGRCAGIWFDAGEWSKLASSHLVHHLRDLWDPTWQRRMREERAEERHKERVKAEIGPELFAQIDALVGAIGESRKRNEAVAYLMTRLRD
ncbi:MAG: zf-TFIIB domain-containing protein [Deltaproteobacteria bacterium]|nr:zf-TFIIB domain-containing protein [Deltaproteobacteria bacterium]